MLCLQLIILLALKVKTLANLVDSMPRRIDAVKKSKRLSN
ncbi:3824_t:CDS:2 [Entrophospora sp. SA101]|nr:3824_t:CDS:2 [Entrophospora sp. SA101]